MKVTKRNAALVTARVKQMLRRFPFRCEFFFFFFFELCGTTEGVLTRDASQHLKRLAGIRVPLVRFTASISICALPSLNLLRVSHRLCVYPSSEHALSGLQMVLP